VYLDSAYLAKFYVNEPDSAVVRAAIGRGNERVTSMWVLAEMTCILHRHIREGALSAEQAQTLRERFLEHVEQGVWTLVPVTEGILRRCHQMVSTLPGGVFLRAGDAVHLTTARELNEQAIWTNDRHLLAAAPFFGLEGRKV
jgi:predicted nucleic acid-binding protein